MAPGGTLTIPHICLASGSTSANGDGTTKNGGATK
jgi:hypothetical protein